MTRSSGLPRCSANFLLGSSPYAVLPTAWQIDEVIDESSQIAAFARGFKSSDDRAVLMLRCECCLLAHSDLPDDR
jgi:hypothetical protein